MKNLRIRFALFLVVLCVGLFSGCEQESLVEQDSVYFEGIELKVSKMDGTEFENTEIEPEYLNDISYYGLDTGLAKDIEDIGNKLRTYKKENPNFSDKELDQYADVVIQELDSEMSRNDLYSYLTNRFNSQEKALFNSNIAKGLLCIANGVSAVATAERNYHDYVLRDYNGDAFRHALWNYLMTKDVGSSFARQWSNAHEYGAVGQSSNERYMDLYNNQVGINLGIANPSTFLQSTFVSKTKEKVRRIGGCIILVNGRYYWSNSYGEK